MTMKMIWTFFSIWFIKVYISSACLLRFFIVFGHLILFKTPRIPMPWICCKICYKNIVFYFFTFKYFCPFRTTSGSTSISSSISYLRSVQNFFSHTFFCKCLYICALVYNQFIGIKAYILIRLNINQPFSFTTFALAEKVT